MALSRWSHSSHYIYTVDDNRVQVCGFGHFTDKNILKRYSVIDRKAKRSGMGLYDRLELFLYLGTWARFRHKMITFEKYYFAINLLRNVGELRYYCLGYSEDIPNFEKLLYKKRIPNKRR